MMAKVQHKVTLEFGATKEDGESYLKTYDNIITNTYGYLDLQQEIEKIGLPEGYYKITLIIENNK